VGADAVSRKKIRRSPGRILYARIEPDLWEAFERLLARTGRTITDEVEAMMQEHLARRRLRPPRSRRARRRSMTGAGGVGAGPHG
jgi:hypothetical protein